MNRRQLLAGGLLGIAGVAAGFLFGWQRRRPDAPAAVNHTPAPAMAGGPAARRFPDLEGRLVSLDEWQAPLRLVNFWATWCPPCLEEIPVLVDLQRRFGADGLQIIGVAIDEVGPVADFARRLGINYPVLIAEGDGMILARELGNGIGALPFTALLAADGSTLATHQGELSAAEAEAMITGPGSKPTL